MHDLTNRRFGRRVVLAFVAKKHSHYYWRVRCDCGTIQEVTAHNLIRGRANQCAACSQTRVGLQKATRTKVAMGTLFGKRMVLALVKIAGKKPYLRVRCECGQEDIVGQASLKAGMANQCRKCQGKLIGARTLTHGHARQGKITTEFRIWTGMINRCTNARSENFKQYGGRGIQVCDRWRNSFEAFFADMGPRPKGLSLDRFPDVNGNYEPENCRWATPKEQIANQRKHGLIEIFTDAELFAELKRRSAI